MKWAALLMFQLLAISLFAQKTAAVTFVTTATFTDSIGKVYDLGEKRRSFCYADNHRQFLTLNQSLNKRKSFNKFQRSKLVHHDLFTDFDNSNYYSYASFKVKKKGLYKNAFDVNKWQINDSSYVINGFKVKEATYTDGMGRLHIAAFTNDLPDYKIKYLAYELPGFVVRYEILTSQRKTLTSQVITATKIEYYDEELNFPYRNKIYDSKDFSRTNY